MLPQKSLGKYPLPAILAFCLLGGAIYLTIALISPPRPLPVDAPATEFSAGRAMQDLEVIARQPHPIGSSPAHAAVRDYILGKVRALDLEPQVLQTISTRVIQPGFLISGSVENILVRLPGTDPDSALLVMAHYDSSPGSPGALDDGTGTVMLLELLRNLQAGAALRQDVIFLFTDGEETGLYGAYAFISEHPWFEDVRLAINLETFVAGPPVILRGNPENGAWVKALARGLPRPGFVSLPYHLFLGNSSSDAVPFLDAGIPTVDIQAPSPTSDYHTNLDRINVVDASVQQHAGAQVLGLIRTLGNQLDFEMRAPDETFFPVLGRLVHYPNRWAFPLAIVAAIFFVGTIIYGFVMKALTWRGLGLGFLASLVSLACSVGVSILLWNGIQALHPEYGYAFNRVHVSDDILYILGFFILALAFTTTSVGLVRKKTTLLDLAAGSLSLWLLAPAIATLVPETSFLGTWVLFSGSLALLLALIVRSSRYAWSWQGVIFLVSAILATFLWVPAITLNVISSGLFVAWIMIAMVALWLVAMLPALDWITSPKRWLLPVSAALVALGFLLSGNFLVGKNTPPPMVNPIGYWLDANDDIAYWVAFSSFYTVPDERQTRLLVDPVDQPYKHLFPQAPSYSITTGVAPLLPLDGPRLEVLMDEWVGDRREVTIHFTTSMHDRLNIFVLDSHLQAVTFPDNERIEVPSHYGAWRLRFDGMPVDGIEIRFEFSTKRAVRFLLLEETTGVPSFPGLETQPAPGTMLNPGGYANGTDFTAIYRRIEIPQFGAE